MDNCFICGQNTEKMFPLLFADDYNKEHWSLGYYCKDCDNALGLLNYYNNFYDWETEEDIEKGLHHIIFLLHKNINNLKKEKDLKIKNIDKIDYHLTEIMKYIK